MGQTKFDIPWLNSKNSWFMMGSGPGMIPWSKKQEWKWRRRETVFKISWWEAEAKCYGGSIGKLTQNGDHKTNGKPANQKAFDGTAIRRGQEAARLRMRQRIRRRQTRNVQVRPALLRRSPRW